MPTFLDAIQTRFGGDFSTELGEVIEGWAPNAARFLEWGSGTSTKVICEIAKKRPNPFVMSIDHDLGYIQQVSAGLRGFAFLHFRCLDLQGATFHQEDKDASYSSYPWLIGLEPDVILIDGRRRSECALTAAQIVAKDGIVILHDWRRTRYSTLRALYDTIHEGKQFLVLRSKLQRTRDKAPRQSCALIVPVRGEKSRNEAEITLPWMRRYAERIGAECIVVGENGTVPIVRLKSEALDVAKSFDRIMLLDADILIRTGSPNLFEITPADHLAAFPEGRYFPREEFCQSANELFQLNGALSPREYFNSGVMVMSRRHIPVLESLRDDLVFGHPQFEQAFLNACRVKLGIPLYPLTPDFNYIPLPEYFPRDWRYGFFIHLAATGWSHSKYTEVWADVAGDRRTFSRAPVSSSARVTQLREVAEQMEGKDARYFDASDFLYLSGAFPMISEAGDLLARIPPSRGERRPAIYGPYLDLEPGSWKGEFRLPDGGSGDAVDNHFDVVANQGVGTILSVRPWPEDGSFEFTVAEGEKEIEIRIWTGTEPFELSLLRLERQDGGRDDS
jgi:Glycosyl transferase family 8